MLVEATYDSGSDTPTEFEDATAFFKGVTVDLLDANNVSLVSTEEADLFDPEATMAAIGA